MNTNIIEKSKVKLKMKRRNNKFTSKFSLLPSEESSEEINWSCSDSSQEAPLNNITNRVHLKRKRTKYSRKKFKNISPLHILTKYTDIVTPKSVASVKSPNSVGKSSSDLLIKSPILTPSHRSLPRNVSKEHNHDSSVSSDLGTSNEKPASPILLLKYKSTTVSPKVRKNLFIVNQCHSSSNERLLDTDRSTSPILNNPNTSLYRKKSINSDKNLAKEVHTNFNPDNVDVCENATKKTSECETMDRQETEQTPYISCKHNIIIESQNSDFKQSHIKLVDKVKSYFESHFSSEASQQSISEYETTPKDSSKSGNELEICTPISPIKSFNKTSKDASSTTSFESDTGKSRMEKFKKGSLAFRMNALLQKQKTHVSLWHNERFLAENSNFVIPKHKFIDFRMKNVNFKYGIYLIEAVNEDNEQFLIVINNLFVYNNSFEVDDVLRIYDPYSILESNSLRIIVNVTKFDCSKLRLNTI